MEIKTTTINDKGEHFDQLYIDGNPKIRSFYHLKKITAIYCRFNTLYKKNIIEYLSSQLVEYIKSFCISSCYIEEIDIYKLPHLVIFDRIPYYLKFVCKLPESKRSNRIF